MADYPNNILKTLQKYWGHNSFRPLQQDIILSILDGNDTLAILPTGGGKSICFQLPALSNNSFALVISPLIALMKDQVDNLLSKNIKAAALYSGMNKNAQETILNQAVNHELSFLYISPERLASPNFVSWLKNMDIAYIAVDEAHCISQWGYDFRPEYLRINDARAILNPIPIIALTGSATPQVKEDIMKQLGFRPPQCKVFFASFFRPNLSYHVTQLENKYHHIASLVKQLKGSGIIYTRSRFRTVELAQLLVAHHISSDYYHAGIPPDLRHKKQTEWINNAIRVMVCTNAFGMGIDKPDVRFVIHFEPPDSLEAFYQEAGRAGRDGQLSQCMLFFTPKDIEDEFQKIQSRFPSNQLMNRIYQAICNFFGIPDGAGKGVSYPFNMKEFASTYDLPLIDVHNTISLLQLSGYIHYAELGKTESTLKIRLTENELYRLQVKDEELNTLFLTILRSRGGYFDHYTPIEELKIARLLQITESKVKSLLKTYSNSGYVDYIPKTHEPVITLIDPRYSEINPDRTLIQFLQKNAEDRYKAMVRFVQNNSVCRSQVISDYFGEQLAKNCGVCDVCKSKKSGSISISSAEITIYAVREALSNGPQSLEDLMGILSTSDKALLLEVLEWLSQNQHIVRKNGKWKWITQ
jgi:ATP-dependent DNA helicase RecQ